MKKQPKTAKHTSQGKLAVLLGVSRQTISHHVRAGNAPPVTDVAAWQSFLAAVGKGGAGGTADVRNQIAIERLKLVRAANEKAERENKAASGLLLDKTEVERACAEAEGYFFQELARLEREAPAMLTGLSAVEVRDKLGAFCKDLRQRSREKFADVAKRKT